MSVPDANVPTTLGLRTVIYHVSDLARAREWYTRAFGTTPYFDEPFYVGFQIGGFELGLDPDCSRVQRYSARTHNAERISVRRRFCLPASSKFAGCSQLSNAARSRGHSAEMIEYQAVSRLRPL